MANLGISTKPSSNKIGINVPKKVVTAPKGPMSVVPKTVVPKKLTVLGPSSKAPTMSKAPSLNIPKLGPSTSSVPNMSTPGGPVAANVSGSNIPRKSGGGGNTSQLAGVGGLKIMERLFGNEASPATADNGISERPSFKPDTVQTTVNGAPAMERTEYFATAPKGPTNFNTGGNEEGYANRALNQDFIANTEAQRQATVRDLQGQLAALQAQQAQQPTTPLTDGLYSPDEDPTIKKDNDNLARLQRKLLEAQQESPEALAAQEEENKIIAAEQEVNAGLNQKLVDVGKEPIPLGFIQGWGTTFNKDANAKLQTLAAQKVPLVQKLANLQSKKQAALDLVKSQIDMKKDKRDRATDIYGKNYERKNDLFDQSLKQQQESQKQAQEQAQIDRKFEEDKRRFGLEYALKQRQLAVSQMNASTASFNAQSNRMRAEKAGINDITTPSFED